MREELNKIFELNIARSLNFHDVDQNIANDNIVICIFEVPVKKLTKFILVHESR